MKLKQILNCRGVTSVSGFVDGSRAGFGIEVIQASPTGEEKGDDVQRAIPDSIVGAGAFRVASVGIGRPFE